MAKQPTNPDGSPVTVKKHDNLETLKKQRTEAREEVERIMMWAVDTDIMTSEELVSKLVYLKDKVLREDV